MDVAKRLRFGDIHGPRSYGRAALPLAIGEPPPRALRGECFFAKTKDTPRVGGKLRALMPSPKPSVEVCTAEFDPIKLEWGCRR